ncbi:MAG: hypothetical protein D6790_11605 [Caldilineae bacterium]|nr:MAG: hypothetical protein D6790_11605 [Caldilineae bacterium]
MLDIDDRAQLLLIDRSGLLARAAAYRERWGQAYAAGVANGAALPRTSAQLLWLHVPHELRHIAHTVSRLLSSSACSILVWTPRLGFFQEQGIHLHLIPQETNAPEESVSDQGHSGSGWSIHLDVTAHPGSMFVQLLALLEEGLGLPPRLTRERLLAGDCSLLESCRPEVPSARNPAKQLALRLSERLPTFWALPPFEEVAQEWRQRYVAYAETQAQWLPAEDMRQVDVMVRFPRYWLQATAYVRLGQVDAPTPGWLAGLEQISGRRRTLLLNALAAADLDEAAACLHLLELGEWVALYAACLAGVDPAAQVARTFLAIHEKSEERGESVGKRS